MEWLKDHWFLDVLVLLLVIGIGRAIVGVFASARFEIKRFLGDLESYLDRH